MQSVTVPKLLSLPSKILSAIFIHGQNMTKDKNPSEGTSFEFLVSHICSQLREISLATPTLWTSIYVDKNCREEQIVEMLARSGTCGLDIQIIFLAEDAVVVGDSQLSIILQHITDNSFRWRSLSVRFTENYEDHPISLFVHSASAPTLQAFSITVDDVDKADSALVNRSVNLPHVLTAGAPKLEFVRLRGFGMHFFRPPLNAVVTLHLDQTRYLPIKYSTLREILTCSPFLANISLYGTILAVESIPGSSDDAIYLPHLQSLRLYSPRGEFYPAILNALDVPNLESLTLNSLHENDLVSLAIMEPTARQVWLSKLKALTFQDCHLSHLAYKHIFKIFENITSVTMSSRTMHNSALLDALRVGSVTTNEPVVPWPYLEILRLTADIWNANKNEIEEAINARTRCGYPISTFVVMAGSLPGVEVYIKKINQHRGPEVKICPGDIVWPEKSSSFIDYNDDLF